MTSKSIAQRTLRNKVDVMKRCLALLVLLVVSPPLVAVADAVAQEQSATQTNEDGVIEGAPVERNPFWPIGYQPPAPKVVAKPKPKPHQDATGNVNSAVLKEDVASEEQWVAARKLVHYVGSAIVHDGSVEERQVLSINKKSFELNDTVVVTNGMIVFAFEIESVVQTNNTVVLKRAWSYELEK